MLDVFKVCKLQKQAEQFMELFNVFEWKILGHYLEFSAPPENFFFLLLYLPSFVWALTMASQAKLFRFVLQHLFGRTKFSVMYNGQGAAFVP